MKLTNKAYNILKWVALIALPVVTTFISTVGVPLGWNFTDTALIVLPAASVALGGLIGTSTVAHNKEEE